MDTYYRQAVRNIVRYGDTDIFPFPIENHILHDQVEEAVALLRSLDTDVRQSLAVQPPANVGALAPVGYTGFRWATQIDPLWNALYLAWVLSIADRIEAIRQPIERQRVFSYRFEWNEEDASCFKRDITWRGFLEHAIDKAQNRNFVVSCDISEFYLRINHHRIENAINHVPGSAYVSPRIKQFLSNLSNTYSFGLPVGGPASRVISELVLAQIDSLLLARGIDFVRYADDYYLFADTQDQAFKSLVTLTQLLIDNQGLQLQKSKTRIMSSAEFISSNPLVHDDEAESVTPLGAARQALLSINVHFDPYSPTAQEDYAAIKQELDRYPVMEIIRAELKKSRVDITLARRLISITRHLEGALLDDAIKTLIENDDILYPVYYNALICAKDVYPRLSVQTQSFIIQHVRGLIENSSRVMVVDLNVQYAVRLLSVVNVDETRSVFYRLFAEDRNEGVKRDIILALARWNDWHWLSDAKNRFRVLTDVSRRAFIIASYSLSDEGEHWRRSIKRELSEFEKLVMAWAEAKHRISGWSIPL
jgi:hypothetical protein